MKNGRRNGEKNPLQRATSRVGQEGGLGNEEIQFPRCGSLGRCYYVADVAVSADLDPDVFGDILFGAFSVFGLVHFRRQRRLCRLRDGHGRLVFGARRPFLRA